MTLCKRLQGEEKMDNLQIRLGFCTVALGYKGLNPDEGMHIYHYQGCTVVLNQAKNDGYWLSVKSDDRGRERLVIEELAQIANSKETPNPYHP